MQNVDSGFQVIFRIGSKATYAIDSAVDDLLLHGINILESPQYAEDGMGIYAFDLYRKHSGKADLSFAEFQNLGLKLDFWTTKKEFPVPISEEIARKSELFNYRSRFICWVLPKILQKFEAVEVPLVDMGEKFFRVTLDFNKLVEAWVEAGTPESWK